MFCVWTRAWLLSFLGAILSLHFNPAISLLDSQMLLSNVVVITLLAGLCISFSAVMMAPHVPSGSPYLEFQHRLDMQDTKKSAKREASKKTLFYAFHFCFFFLLFAGMSQAKSSTPDLLARFATQSVIMLVAMHFVQASFEE